MQNEAAGVKIIILLPVCVCVPVYLYAKLTLLLVTRLPHTHTNTLAHTQTFIGASLSFSLRKCIQLAVAARPRPLQFANAKSAATWALYVSWLSPPPPSSSPSVRLSFWRHQGRRFSGFDCAISAGLHLWQLKWPKWRAALKFQLLAKWQLWVPLIVGNTR